MKRYNITVNGTAYDVTVEETDASAAPVAAAAPAPKKAAAPKAAAPAGGAGNVKIEAPMPGTVMDVKLKVGDKVTIFSAEPGSTLEDMALVLDTIPYEIMTSISARVKRIYTER